MTKIIIYKKLFIIVSFWILTIGCKKFIEIDPPKDQIISDLVYSNDQTAIAAMRGIYSQMMVGNFASGGIGSVTINAGLSADEFINYSTSEFFLEFSLNNLSPGNTNLKSSLWQAPYKIIYFVNVMLENLDRSNGVSPIVKQQLQGEAKFIRAFCHLLLTNLFGEVPLILTSDYRVNAIASSNTDKQIYDQIIKDLTESKAQLADNYPSTERIRVNKWAATALLARAFLYSEDWNNAAKQATEVISRSDLYNLLDDLDQVFLRNSKETILQFAPTLLSGNTNEGAAFILIAPPGPSNLVTLSQDLVDNFSEDDLRLKKWVGAFTSGTNKWHYAYKYKIRTGATPRSEYSMVIRLAELYLIRAEALIQLGDIENGIKDLNLLRKRSRQLPSAINPNPLPDLPGTLDKANALLSLEKERRLELFSEWGHRWFDLKRTGRANTLLEPLKSPNWKDTDQFYPIPSSELVNNGNLKQNPGYQ